jgi:nicotinic acid mononucleotide adenylyltransferase
MMSPEGRDDRVYASARERVKMLRRWIAQRDSGLTDSTTIKNNPNEDDIQP